MAAKAKEHDAQRNALDNGCKGTKAVAAPQLPLCLYAYKRLLHAAMKRLRQSASRQDVDGILRMGGKGQKGGYEGEKIGEGSGAGEGGNGVDIY